MSDYIITHNILAIVDNLYKKGYEGEARLARTFPSGVSHYLEGCMVIELTGFCKETLYLGEKDGYVSAFGRYSLEREFTQSNPVVEDIVQIAWDMFTSYESRGYSMPEEFKTLFLKYGYIEEKTETVKKIVRKK